VKRRRDRADTSRKVRSRVQLHASALARVFDCEPSTPIPKDNSYIISYRDILAYFGHRKRFAAADLVRGAHIAYGWMPTVLELHPGRSNMTLDKGAQLLTRAKRHGLTDAQIEDLARLINNSLVGASKLLHFVAPEKFAIWDSNVYKFIFPGKPYDYRVVRKVAYYRDYLDRLAKIQANGRFDQFHASVNKKVGYDVSALRAIELVMYWSTRTQTEGSHG